MLGYTMKILVHSLLAIKIVEANIDCKDYITFIDGSLDPDRNILEESRLVSNNVTRNTGGDQWERIIQDRTVYLAQASYDMSGSQYTLYQKNSDGTDFEYCCENRDVATDCLILDKPLNVQCCDCSAITLRFVADSTFSNTLAYPIDGNTPYFSFSPFTTNKEGCEIASYELVETSSDTAYSVITFTETLTNDVYYYHVPESQKYIEATYSFRLKVTAQNGNVHYESITFTVGCDGVTNNINTNSYYNAMTDQQYVALGASTNKFYTQVFQYQNDYCQQTMQFDIIQLAGGDDSYLLLDAPVFENDMLIVRPNSDNINVDDVEYKFKVNVQDSAGNSITSAGYYLLVGCPVSAYDQLSFEAQAQAFTILIGSGNPFTTGNPVTYTSFGQGSFVTCQVQSTFVQIETRNFVDTYSHGGTTPVISQTSTDFTCQQSDCGHISVDQNDFIYSIQFRIEFTIGGSTANQVRSFWSEYHTLTIQCTSQALESTITNTQIYMQQGYTLNNTVSFSSFTCLYTQCCTISTSINSYSIVYTNSSNTLQPLTCCQGILDNSGQETEVTYTIDVATAGTVLYQIKVTSQENDEVISSQIELIIEPIPVVVINDTNSTSNSTFNPFTDIIENINLTGTNLTENLPPTFKKIPSCPFLELDFEDKLVYPLYKCQLGIIEDPNDGDIVEKFELAYEKSMDKFMYFDEQTMTIFLDPNKLQRSDLGVYTISYHIEDQHEAKTDGSFRIFIQEPIDIHNIQKEITQEIIKDIEVVQVNIKEDLRKNLSAKIDKISNMGQLIIKFNQTMKTSDINITQINGTILDIYVHQMSKRELTSPTDFNLTWNVTSFKDNLLEIQLYFINPIMISAESIQDKLFVSLKKPQYAQLFRADNGGKELHEQWWTLSNGIGKQMEPSEFNQSFDESSDSLNKLLVALMIFSIFLYIVTQGGLAMKFMFIKVRALQLILHLPLMQVSFPANVMLIVRVLIPTVGFDVLESFFDWESQDILEFNFEKHEKIKDEVYNQLVDIGYDSYNSVMLLQTLGIMLLFYFIQVILLAIIAFCVFVSNNKCGGQQFVANKKKQLFFSPIIELFIQGYFEFLIAGILTTKLDKYKLSGEMISNIVGLFSLSFTLIILPISLLLILFVKADKIKDKAFTDRWGQLYSNIDPLYRSKDIAARAYFLFFVLRRIIFIYTAFFQSQYVTIQILIVIFMQLFMSIYQGAVQPSFNRFTNRLDLYNEFSVLILTQQILMFTDMVPNLNIQFVVGWSWIAILLTLVMINLSLILYNSFRTFKLVMIRFYRKIKKVAQKVCRFVTGQKTQKMVSQSNKTQLESIINLQQAPSNSSDVTLASKTDIKMITNSNRPRVSNFEHDIRMPKQRVHEATIDHRQQSSILSEEHQLGQPIKIIKKPNLSTEMNTNLIEIDQSKQENLNYDQRSIYYEEMKYKWSQKIKMTINNETLIARKQREIEANIERKHFEGKDTSQTQQNVLQTSQDQQCDQMIEHHRPSYAQFKRIRKSQKKQKNNDVQRQKHREKMPSFNTILEVDEEQHTNDD